MNHEAKIIKFRYLMSCMLSQGPTFMKFNRSRKFYILCSFGVVLTVFFYSHWKTFKILDQNNKRIALVDQESRLANGEHERDEERRDEKCRLGNDVQTSAHCVDNAVLGVAPSDKLSYQPNTLDHFVCLDGELSITWKSVNDDYCDCKDGSDEPGTSACPNMRFYCAGKQQYLPSSRVNDGICDCCDGSDEWKKQTVRADVLKKHNFNIKYAPCGNFC